MNATRKTVVLHDVDGRIPNLALLKLSTFHRQQGWHVVLSRARNGARPAFRLDADKHLASVVFRTPASARAVGQLQALYGDRIEFGGSGVDLGKRLSPEVETCFPDYSLYDHKHYALGFLTRGCNKRCDFCVVPEKEGRLKRQAASFDDFVPDGQRNVLLLDDNLLAYPGVEDLLGEMIARRYAINFSQTLDIAYLDEARFRLLCQVDSRNARFTKRLIYFSLNHPRDIRHFEKRAGLLNKGYIPFFQQYWPIAGVPDRVPEDYFDMDLNAMIRLTFHTNGQNWEKYLRWISTRYFQRYGRYYRPLIEILHRYNNRHRIEWFRMNPACLSDELYRDHRDSLAELQATLRPSIGPRPPRGPRRCLAQAAPDST